MPRTASCLNADWDECPEGGMDYITYMLGTGFRDKMIATMGGTTIKVPSHIKVLDDEHQLVRCLGRIDAEELVDTLPGEMVYIPVGERANPKGELVANMVMEGRTSAQIARALDLSERQVCNIRNQLGLGVATLAKRLGVSLRAVPEAIRTASPRQLAPR